MSKSTYLIVWSKTIKGKKENDGTQKLTDHWAVVEDLDEATTLYEALLTDKSTYIASICGIVRSTDYPTIFDRLKE